MTTRHYRITLDINGTYDPNVIDHIMCVGCQQACFVIEFLGGAPQLRSIGDVVIGPTWYRNTFDVFCVNCRPRKRTNDHDDHTGQSTDTAPGEGTPTDSPTGQ